MADTVSKEQRSWNMSRIRGSNTKPERIVRSLLFRLGYRFTVHGPANRKLPGKPDIALPKHRTVIQVHGCFWHLHTGCHNTRLPKDNGLRWQKKLEGNARRDQENQRKLEALGWHVLVIWECQTQNTRELTALAARLPLLIDATTPSKTESESLDETLRVAEDTARQYRVRRVRTL